MSHSQRALDRRKARSKRVARDNRIGRASSRHGGRSHVTSGGLASFMKARAMQDITKRLAGMK